MATTVMNTNSNLPLSESTPFLSDKLFFRKLKSHAASKLALFHRLRIPTPGTVYLMQNNYENNIETKYLNPNYPGLFEVCQSTPCNSAI